MVNYINIFELIKNNYNMNVIHAFKERGEHGHQRD